MLSPIQDCDETFNYVEPLHYLLHGYGRQTWEYSPTYAIRSWTYIAMHALLLNLLTYAPHPFRWFFSILFGFIRQHIVRLRCIVTSKFS